MSNPKKKSTELEPDIYNGTEGGASLVEYVLLVSLVALIAVAAMSTLGEKLSTQYSSFADKF
jgi:Flp pilus assembly pilin Flp